MKYLSTLKKMTKDLNSTVVTKRNILSDINRIFDVLGLFSPVEIVEKLIYSEICSMKIRWDENVPEKTGRRYIRRWESLKSKKSISISRFRASTTVL